METRLPLRSALRDPVQDSVAPRKSAPPGNAGKRVATDTTSRTRRTKRQLLRSAHTWIGLIAGLLISIVALTGSLIVFRTDLEPSVAPLPAASSFRSEASGLNAGAHSVIHFHPDSRIRRVRLPVGATRTYLFQIESGDKKTERVLIDADSGRVLGTQQSGWIDWTIDLHRNLLAGKPGRAMVGALGLILLTLSISGLLIWFTGARNWKAWFSKPKGSGTRYNYELHRLCGLWAYFFLALISFTGVGLAYPDTFRSILQLLTATPLQARAPKSKSAVLKSLDEYLAAGVTAMPDATAIEIRLPEPGKGPVELRLHRAGDLAPAANRVYLNPSTAAVLAVDRLSDKPWGTRLMASLAPIHYGEFGGLPVKAAWSLLALTPVLLFVTGTIAWWRRSGRNWFPAR